MLTFHVQVDLLYLHNVAEMFPAPLQTEKLLERLKAAFVWLEGVRMQGRIRAYGMATWSCFRVPPGAVGHVSIQDIVHLAQEAGGLDHGFRSALLP